MTSVAASFFASLTAPAPQAGVMGAGIGMGVGAGGGQFAAGAFGAMLAEIPSGAAATVAVVPTGTTSPAPTIATLLASTADFAETPPVGARLPCGPLSVVPAAAKAAPAPTLPSPVTAVVLPGLAALAPILAAAAPVSAAPAPVVSEPARVSDEPAPGSAEPAPAPVSPAPAPFARATNAAPKSPDMPREAILSATSAKFERAGERAGGLGTMPVAPPIATAATSSPTLITRAEATMPVASAAAPMPAPLAAPQADPAAPLAPAPEAAASLTDPLVTPRPGTSPTPSAERSKAARDDAGAGEPQVGDAPAPPVAVFIAAPVASAAATAVSPPATGAVVSAKRATTLRSADAPADLAEPTDPAEPMPDAVPALPMLAGVIAALPVAKTIEAAQPAAPSVQPNVISAASATADPRGPIANGPSPAIPGDRIAPAAEFFGHATPDHRGDGAPSHAAAPVDPAATATLARDDVPAFTPAMSAAPAPVTTPADPGRSGIITAQPGQIGQELGVAIAHHVAAGNAAPGGGETITLRLDPVDMGRIEVKLSFDDGGTLRAIVSADNPAALDMLRRDSADLGRALVDAGVRADAQTLSFDTRGGTGKDGGNGQPGGQPGQRQPEPKGGATPGAPEDVTPTYRPLRTRGGVDLVA